MKLTKLACDKTLQSLNGTISNIQSEVDTKTVQLTDTWEHKERSTVKRVKDNWERLQKTNDDELFTEIQVKGDGNCFYRCVSLHF